MVKKSVLLMNVFAVGLTLGSGAEAVKKIPQIDGQGKLYQCRRLPSDVRQQLQSVTTREEQKTATAKAERERTKENMQKENQAVREWFLKVSTEKS